MTRAVGPSSGAPWLGVLVLALSLTACSLDRQALGTGRPDASQDAALDAPSFDAGLDTNELDAGPDAPADDTCVPAAESCNGMDDDCDTMVDETIPMQTCGVGPCQSTVPGCTAGAVPVCTPSPPGELDLCLDGIDNDCNGAIDGVGCATVLFQYTADVLAEAAGWTATCSAGCPAGGETQGAGNVSVRADAAGGLWFTHPWAPSSAAVTVVRFRTRGLAFGATNSAFVMATVPNARIVVDVVPSELRIATDCGPTVVPVTADQFHDVRLEFQPAGTVRTYVDGVMADERAPCAVPGPSAVVGFGSATPATPGEIAIDDVLAYTM